MTTMARETGQIVFVIDDEPKVCETICETLETSGFRAVCFSDPAKCIERLSCEECDLLVADLKMPGVDGIELMRQAKLIIPWLPVVIITAYGDIPIALEATRAGAADFVEKPLIKENFVHKIKSLMPYIDGEPKRLTKTETSVLRLVAQGKSNSEIAHLLHRSVRTIELHRSHAMNKLGLHDFTDLLKRIGGTQVADFLANMHRNSTDAGQKDIS